MITLHELTAPTDLRRYPASAAPSTCLNLIGHGYAPIKSESVIYMLRPRTSTDAMRCALFVLVLIGSLGSAAAHAQEIVSFNSGDKVLEGLVYKPSGPGPFPAVVYHHGSAGGMLSKDAFDALDLVFVSHGWVFFGPFRRGQGLSAAADPYIRDQIATA